MAAEAEHRRFRVAREQGLGIEPAHGTYSYSLESTLDMAETLPETTVVFDSDDGHLISFSARWSRAQHQRRVDLVDEAREDSALRGRRASLPR